jgi:hypothetical protein
MPIVRRELTKTVWETPETMIRDFVEHYELVLEGTPNQIIYGYSFPFSSPDSLFIYRVDESLWLYRNGDYLKVYPYRVGTIVPFYGSPGVKSQSNVAYSGNTGARPWALCDGGTYNGIATPNLRGRGFIGVDSSDSGATSEANGFMHESISSVGNPAGADLVQLKEEHLPAHDHSYCSPADITAGGQAVSYYNVQICQGSGKSRSCYNEQRPHPQSNTAQEKNTVTRYTTSMVGWTGNITSFSESATSSPRQFVHNNLPPYIVLNWKMYVGY